MSLCIDFEISMSYLHIFIYASHQSSILLFFRYLYINISLKNVCYAIFLSLFRNICTLKMEDTHFTVSSTCPVPVVSLTSIARLTDNVSRTRTSTTERVANGGHSVGAVTVCARASCLVYIYVSLFKLNKMW